MLALATNSFPMAAVGTLCGVSARTAAEHLEHAYRKLDDNDRIAAVLRLRAASSRERSPG